MSDGRFKPGEHHSRATEIQPGEYQIEKAGDMVLTKTAQTRMVGNSVPPPVARAIVEANLGGVEARAA